MPYNAEHKFQYREQVSMPYHAFHMIPGLALPYKIFQPCHAVLEFQWHAIPFNTIPYREQEIFSLPRHVLHRMKCCVHVSVQYTYFCAVNRFPCRTHVSIPCVGFRALQGFFPSTCFHAAHWGPVCANFACGTNVLFRAKFFMHCCHEFHRAVPRFPCR